MAPWRVDPLEVALGGERFLLRWRGIGVDESSWGISVRQARSLLLRAVAGDVELADQLRAWPPVLKRSDRSETLPESLEALLTAGTLELVALGHATSSVTNGDELGGWLAYCNG